MKLPRLESLIILVFFGCVALWGHLQMQRGKRSEIGSRLREMDEKNDARRPTLRRDTVFRAPKPSPTQYSTPPQPSPAWRSSLAAPAQPTAQRPVVTTAPPTNTAQPAQSAPQAQGPRYSTLYVTIDGLKMRKEPNLKSAVVAKLELYEPVSFLNQKTEKTEEINLGYEKVTDHWVKIRTKAGKEGWVFGAGVHYYKMKRKGVME